MGEPNFVHLRPDRYHLRHVGRVPDGDAYWVTTELVPTPDGTIDYVCTYRFDDAGRLTSHDIEKIGLRGEYEDGAVGRTIDRHLSALGRSVKAAVVVAPFSIEHDGEVFGLVPRDADGEWFVDTLPSHDIMFFAPWEIGAYDT